jgi:coronin-1B/1C/6
VTGDQQYVKASAKYFAVGMAGGGGPIYVNRLDRPGRFELEKCSYVHGHTGAVLDFDWNPFDDSMMATASDDTKIKIWQIPDDWEPTDENGNAKDGKDISESVAELSGHRKKVTLLRYHPTAGNTLLSASGDYTVKLWDVENSQAVQSFEGAENILHDIVWDYTGDQFACTCKDKHVRLVDPRANEAVASVLAHDGTKSTKVVYANDSGKVFTFGASRQSSREIKVWDIRSFDKCITTESIDTAAGGLIPLWDSDTSVLYLCGKGDGTVRLYEYEDKSPFIFKLNDGFRSNIPGKGYCMVPKRGLDIMKHETCRILKVTNDSGIHPLHFHVPRKSDAFQDDIFPATAGEVPAHSHTEWAEGSSKGPVKISLDPVDSGRRVSQVAVKAPMKAFKTVASVSADLKAAEAKVKSLEEQLKGGSAGASAGAGSNSEELDAAKAKANSKEEELKAAQAKVTSLEAELKAAQAKVSSLEEKVKEQEVQINLLEEKLKEANLPKEKVEEAVVPEEKVEEVVPEEKVEEVAVPEEKVEESSEEKLEP